MSTSNIAPWFDHLTDIIHQYNLTSSRIYRNSYQKNFLTALGVKTTPPCYKPLKCKPLK